MPPVDLGEQSVLAAEVVADERPVHAGLGGNHPHRDPGEAAVGEQALGGGQSCSRVSEVGGSGGVQLARGAWIAGHGAASYSRIAQSFNRLI